MERKILFVLIAVFGLSAVCAAQGKVVTNFDLEKFKQQRLAAEKGLDEYYARYGLTKEDVAKRDAAEAKEREDLALQLRAARVERERLENEQRAREAAAANTVVLTPVTPMGYDYPNYIFYGNRWISTPVWGRPGDRHDNVQWRATPGGIVYEPGNRSSYIWSAPTGQRPVPMWRRPR